MAWRQCSQSLPSDAMCHYVQLVCTSTGCFLLAIRCLLYCAYCFKYIRENPSHSTGELPHSKSQAAALYHNISFSRSYKGLIVCTGTQQGEGIIIFGSLWGLSDFIHLDALNSKQVCYASKYTEKGKKRKIRSWWRIESNPYCLQVSIYGSGRQ